MAQSTIAFRSSSESPAQLLVKSIAKDHGYLGDHVYAKMDVDTRREVQEAMLAKDKLIGGSVTVYDETSSYALLLFAACSAR